jgi:hypothetical protein
MKSKINIFFTRVVTLIGILGGIASCWAVIDGLCNQKIGISEIILFTITFLAIIFVLLFPNSKLEKNVASKIRIYDINKTPEFIELRGEFKISGTNPITIVFEFPFVKSPYFEIFNTYSCEGELPTVMELTRYKAIIKIDGYTPFNNQTYSWVASGKCIRPNL